MSASHPCYNNGFDEACVRTLCESSNLCDGYQRSPSGDAYWLMGTDAYFPIARNANYRCFMRTTALMTGSK